MFVLYDFVRGQFVFGSLAGSNNTRGLGINCLYSLFGITQFNSNIEVQTESITLATRIKNLPTHVKTEVNEKWRKEAKLQSSNRWRSRRQSGQDGDDGLRPSS